MIAICQIRQQPWYRREAFESGLRKAGYSLVQSGRPACREDLLVIWNRYGGMESMANTWEQLGGTVIVCENGYCGKDAEGRQFYAIGVHGHNGSGWFPVSDEDRFSSLGIKLLPWRTGGEHILVCGQRGIGSATMASPQDWHSRMADRLRKVTDRPIKIRLHPGNQPAKTHLEDDLENAYACVIWSSGSGVKALQLGIPVFYDAPHWICEHAAERTEEINFPAVSDLNREDAMHKMSYGQWSVAEIEAGIPFARIMERIAECPTW